MDFLPSNFWKYVESILFIVAGIYVHVYQIAVTTTDQDEDFEPNAASTIFVVTVLCACARCRPFWPCSMKSPIGVIQFIFDMLATLYTVDLLFRRMWLPLLKGMQFVFASFADRSKDWGIEVVANAADWLNNAGYECCRILLALMFLLVMAQSSGALNYLKAVFESLVCGTPSRESHSSRRRKKTGTPRKRRASPTCSMEGCPGEFYQF